MAITKCRECGGQVSTEALACPHCGAKNPSNTASQAQPATAKATGMALWKKILIGFGVLWLIGTVAQLTAKRKDRPSEATAQVSPAPTTTAETGGGPQCFNRGDAIATVYLANIKQAVDVGMLASEMMQRGCQDSVGTQGQACVDECKLGFRAKAKQWVKDGSL